MDMNSLIARVKNHPQYSDAGMILCHNGVVRGTSRDGRKVNGLRVSVDHEKLDNIIADSKKLPGIVEVLIEISEEKDLSVGDDVMCMVVAGDIRENVISALSHTLNTVKSTVTKKTEFFVD